MSNTSFRPIPTLKGMFSVPRATQGRNFLKENKQSLRSLEKATTEKLASKEPVRPKWMPPLRRTASETHEHESKRCEADGGSNNNHRPMSRQQEKDNSLFRGQNNSRSMTRLNNRTTVASEATTTANAPTSHYAPSERSERRVHLAPQKSTERCMSCGSSSGGSGRSSNSIAIQTEDITDANYLTNALKKCSLDNQSEAAQLPLEAGDYEDNYRDYERYIEDEQPLSPRSKFNPINIDEHEELRLPAEQEEEAPLSARSRGTIASSGSNLSNKSKRREHKLGSRDELRLPRYLEKEKRERAELKERLEARDPDCPYGHVLLSEQERLAKLATAKQNFEVLIKELNHMPMSAQTLRIRARKAEIDKELSVLEETIRIYSKEKVYIKLDPTQHI